MYARNYKHHRTEIAYMQIGLYPNTMMDGMLLIMFHI